jgi:murein DD-endopeptidase MepM/ murein hydrolase activator NlpD
MTRTVSDTARRASTRLSRWKRRTGAARPGLWLRPAAASIALLVATGLAAPPALADIAPAVTGPATLAAAPAWPTISSGQSGVSVTTAQYLLRQRGETIAADGAFGALTKSAVQRFQTANGLGPDGVVGPLTWAKLVVPLDAGASGEAVRALQTQLKRYTATVTVDGTFAGATNTAVTDFKSNNGLGSGTAVDAVVWQWLVGGYPGAGTYALPLDHSALPRSEYDDPHHDYPAIDLPVGTGTRAYAAGAGTVITVSNSACGTGMQIKDANNVIFMYCHFSQRVATNGATVAPGQLVGYTGATGDATGPHLHFEIRVDGANRCPQNFLLALYDGVTPPNPASLPASGCISPGFAGQPELD